MPDLKRIFMGKWHWIENQPLLREIYKEPPFISYRKGKSLKKYLWEQNSKGQGTTPSWEIGIVFGLSTFFQSLEKDAARSPMHWWCVFADDSIRNLCKVLKDNGSKKIWEAILKSWANNEIKKIRKYCEVIFENISSIELRMWNQVNQVLFGEL